MAEGSSIMGLVAAFIGIAIMLGIGTQILGNTSMDCSNLPGYNATLNGPNGTSGTASHTGWALQCEDNNESSQNAYAILIIILIVVAAVAILFVVRML